MPRKEYEISKTDLYQKYVIENLPTRKIAEIFGCSTSYVQKQLRIFGIPRRPSGPRFGVHINDIKGKTFGNLLVLELDIRKGGRIYWKCRCLKCNVEKPIRTDRLTEGDITSCGCMGKERKFKLVRKGHQEISGPYWSTVMRNSKILGREFTITLEYIWELFLKQNRRCALSGEQIYFTRNRSLKLQTASLDRIDSSKGYIEGNVQWIHKKIQPMKRNMDEIEFIKLCKVIGDHNNDRIKE